MSQYAEWMMEHWRGELGLNPKDTSKDKEIIAQQERGEKISKSKHVEQTKEE